MLHDPHSAASDLLDRVSEREVLQRLVADVHAGNSRVLVLRGEPGIGKTSLLEHLAETARGCRVARAAGVESEMELAFAGLHQLCAPLLGRCEGLPGPQRDALHTAFGLSEGTPPDRFLVGLAVMTLLADAAERQPLICVVDDAQWLDRVSVQTLAFAARRLLAERVGMVFALRDSGHDGALGGLPSLVVEGLPAEEARRLLEATIPGPLDAQVRHRILGEAGGNPLALVELPRGRTPIALAGGFDLPAPMPLTGRIEQGFVQQLESLPPEARRLLLLAAADPVGDAMLLRRAAQRLGLDVGALAPAEAAGLIVLDAGVRFRHPLVRSAAYRAAGVSERREVHAALAEATAPETDPDRRAWHLAHAASEPDEAVAAELERSAGRAQARGGLSAAAAFLQRAAELTPDPGVRVERSLAAARAKLEVADAASASELLAAAELGPLGELQQARLERLRARIVFAARRGRDAPPLLLAAAGRLDRLDAGMARETYLEALQSAMFAGRLATGPGPREIAEAARGSCRASSSPGAAEALLDALVTRFTDGYAPSVEPLSRAIGAFASPEVDGEDRRWLWLACRMAQDLWDEELWETLATVGVQLARQTGALGLLPVMANYLAMFHVHRGDFATAAALVDEVEAIRQVTGVPPLKHAAAALAAFRGDPAQLQAVIEAPLRGAMERGEGSAVGGVGWFTALMHNSHGEYSDALIAAHKAGEHEDIIYYGWALPELIEAGVRCGRPDDASAALERLGERARASATEWALGVEARCRGLVGDDEARYVESIERLARSRAAVDLARSHLVYGEWLRREQRRIDARLQLRTAHDMLSRMGARAFAERAVRELRATGETVRSGTPETRDALTPQELQVATLARDGLTNPEIGAQLFISPRTVEYHLRKVFRKLDVTTRKGLRAALGANAG